MCGCPKNRYYTNSRVHCYGYIIMIKQEGIAEGRIEGEKALLKSLIEKKMAKKYSAEQISAMLEVDVSEVENIMKEIQNEKYL